MSKKVCHATNCRKRLTANKSKYCSTQCQRRQYMKSTGITKNKTNL